MSTFGIIISRLIGKSRDCQIDYLITKDTFSAVNV